MMGCFFPIYHDNEYLHPARMSPRITDSTFYWYEGDIFSIDFCFTLEDADHQPIDIDPTSTIVFKFLNSQREEVWTVEFDGSSIADNTVTLCVDESATALFPVGRYSFDIEYCRQVNSRLITQTIINDNRIVVE